MVSVTSLGRPSVPPDGASPGPDLATSDAVPPEIFPLLIDTVLGRSGTGVVVFDEDLRYVMANEVAADINGMPAEEHLGRRVEEVVPEVADSFAPVLHSVLRTGEPALNVEVSGATASAPGRPRWWNASVVRLQGGTPATAFAVVVFTEVTDQRAAHERLRLVLDNLFTFVAVLSSTGELLELNRAASTAAGVEPAQVLGQPFWTAPWWRHDPDLPARIRRAVDSAASGRSVRFDVEVSLGDDRVIPIDFQLAPIIEQGEVTALVPSGLDIAGRVEEAERLASLALLSNRLNAAETHHEVVDAITSMRGRIEGAEVINIAVIDPDEHCLRVSMDGMDLLTAERWAVLPLGEEISSSFHDAIRTGEVITVRTHAERTQRYPHHADEAARLGIEMTVAMPLTGEDGGTVGAIGLGWRTQVDLSPAVSARLELLQDMCEQALQRARRAEVRGELISALQTELLGDLPGVAGLEVAVEYLPAVNDIGFGGDWYDVMPVGSATAFIVGDVVGHGITAASRMAQLKGLLRGLVVSSTSERVFAATTAALTSPDSYVATAALVQVDAGRGVVSTTLAGHPPPILRRPDGAVELLDGSLGPPIGITHPGVAPVHTAIEPGSLLVLYTDGLIERRSRSIDDGLAELARAVRSVPDDADAERAKAIVLDRLVGSGHHEDDIAIIVVRIPFAG